MELNIDGFLEYQDEDKQICKINVFDDGNQDLKNSYENIWLIIGTNNRGKIRLQNIIDNEVILSSISAWKVELLDLY